MSEKKVVIVGGGNAGLSAAYQLHKAGVPYVLLEATNRVGGRVKYGYNDDVAYNDGAAFTEPQWATTFEYLEEFGLMDRVVEPPIRIYGLYLDGEVKYFQDTGNLFKSALQMKGIPLKLIAQGARFLPALIHDMGLVGEGHDFSKLAEISEMSAREWCERHGAPEIADKLLGPMLGTMVLSRSDQISAAHPIALMKLMAGMDGVIGGLKTINEHIYEVVKDNVRLNTPVREIVIEDDEIKSVELVDGEVIAADKVICCTDAVDARRLMPNLPTIIDDELATCDYCRTWHYVYYSPKKVVPDGFLSLFIPESEDARITTVFAVPLLEMDHVPGTEPKHDFSGNAQVVHAFTSGWYDDELMPLSDEERHLAVAKEIARFLPEFDIHSEVIAANRMDRAINLEAPGQFEAIDDLKRNHLDDVKGLYLAGEYMFLIACTEGAWMTGKDAALKLIDDAE